MLQDLSNYFCLHSANTHTHTESVNVIEYKKIRPYLDKATPKNLYFTFVYPYLIYCVDVWGNACDTHLEPIIKMQKRCIRTITFSCYFE